MEECATGSTRSKRNLLYGLSKKQSRNGEHLICPNLKVLYVRWLNKQGLTISTSIEFSRKIHTAESFRSGSHSREESPRQARGFLFHPKFPFNSLLHSFPGLRVVHTAPANNRFPLAGCLPKRRKGFSFR